MCGIVGYIGKKFADSVLTVCLEKLQYRGYDSVGIAVLNDGTLNVRKCAGKIHALNKILERDPIAGNIGIGHTRWATHGEPTSINAHPHTDCTNTIAVVHNGIIENYISLKETLQKEGHIFRSETDTEVLSHLVERYLRRGSRSLKEAVCSALKEAEGSYAVAFISRQEPDKIVVARHGSPLIIGIGDGENFVASDIPAVLPGAHKVIYLDDGEVGMITRTHVQVFDMDGNPKDKQAQLVEWDADMIEKGPYEHFMLKEIYEQPQVMDRILSKYVINEETIGFSGMCLTELELSRIRRIVIQACGTSWHAGLVGKFFLEQIARVPTEVDISSEFRYRDPVFEDDMLLISISQSGETADTLEGLRKAKENSLPTLSICNVPNSTIARESDAVIYIHAGPEIGVASTKAYTAQLAVLYLFSIYLGRIRYLVDKDAVRRMVAELEEVPGLMQDALDISESLKECVDRCHNSNSFIFLGRGYNYPSALEGALKLKEISYIHAVGYPAGEFKHGPIALVDENVPVVCIATNGNSYHKMLSNINEVRARNGKIIMLTNVLEGDVRTHANCLIDLPDCKEILSPMVVAVPLQLLAYEMGVRRGCNVDQPRNLAKSVTVE